MPRKDSGNRGEHTRLVRDVERDFGSAMADRRPAVVTVGQWTIEEYGQLIEPRVRDLIRRESDPKVLPWMLEVWGVDPPDTRDIMARATGLMRRLS